MSKLIPLNNLLMELSEQDFTVAYSSEKKFSSKDFLSDCSNLINTLFKEHFSECVLSCKNSYYFAVGLFSLLHLQKKICLPPGMEKGQINELSHGRSLISDFCPSAVHPIQEKTLKKVDFYSNLDGSISLFTSGSTGKRKEIKKSLSQFNEEIKSLTNNWDFNKESSVVSSVSHQHIYGLLFKILWPLASNRPFFIEDCMFEDQLNSAFKKYPESILISCPAHLDAMTKFTNQGFLENRTIFSSGAPLSKVTAKEIEAISNLCPVEVFGSTETGGIGWRRQTASQNWQTLTNVTIRVDENKILSVNSPFCEVQNEWYETGDKAELLPSESFKHLGRKDRIVKVSGKRLSLDEMELKLNSSAHIKDCKILVLTEKSSTARESTAAILVLSEEGSKYLSEVGRRKFAMSLKNKLKEFFPPVVLPRFWRYVDEFPKNSQGKIEVELLSLFLCGYDEAENRFPEIKYLSKQSDQCTLKFRAPENCDFFEGHFPKKPILPGVAQVFWVQFYAGKLLNCKIVKGINKLKFHHVIQPNELCILELKDNNNKVAFTYSVGAKLCSSGSLSYE